MRRLFAGASIFMLVHVVACNNVTDKLIGARFDTRQSRLLSFNAEKDGKIQVELDFSVPFLSIPVKPETGKPFQAMANINIGAIALAGMMAFGAAVIVPATYHLMGFKSGANYAYHVNGNKYRSDNDVNTSSSMWRFISSVDQALSENDIDSTSCVQRAICWTVKNSMSNMSKGQASSTDKIIDGLATHSWMRHMVDGSVFQAAIDSALNGVDCSAEYNQCKVNQKSLQSFGRKLVNAIYSRK